VSFLSHADRGSVILNRTSPNRDVYDAVADPTRRELLRLLADAEELPLHELTAQFQMGRTAVSKHLAILKEAGLVADRKVGRETRYRLNAAPLQEIKDWVSFYEKFWNEKVALLKKILAEE
jgi:DNA-binding transcriptional ArsR family regulator